MHARTAIHLFLILVAMSSVRSGLASAKAEEPRHKPNIIVIITDDHGYADIGFHGSKEIPTPNLDALAKGGVICTDGYVTCPVCSPTRAGLLTGRYQQRSGFEDNTWSNKVGLSTEATTIADYLQSGGYKTLAIGKWHLGQLPQFRPLKRGFTDHYGFYGGGRSFLPLKESVGVPFIPKDPDAVDIWRNEERIEDPPHVTDAFGEAAVDYIGKNKDTPFFIYLAFNAPHVPLQSTQKYLDRFANIPNNAHRTYAAMISAVDDAVGRINEKLRETGLEDDTLIFFLSDNGGHPMANTASNKPLRGEKGTIYEGGIRVPFVVKWTGKLPAGKKYSSPVFSLDIMATSLAAAKIKPKENAPLDGVDLIPHLTGEISAAPHETMYWRYIQHRAIRHGKWKLAMPYEGPEELFDLDADISESKDLSAAEPETVEKLKKLYAEWNAELPPGAKARPKRNPNQAKPLKQTTPAA